METGIKKIRLGILFYAMFIIAFLFCEEEPLENPILISPEDGLVITNKPPQFLWFEDTTENGYVLLIVKDDFQLGETLLRDTVYDTTYSMSQDIFDEAVNGEYVWSVTPVLESRQTGWWEFRTFIIDKSLPGPPELLSPLEGSVFESEPPTFIWESDSLAQSYLLTVYGDDIPIPDTLVADTISDTFYQLQDSTFVEAFNGTYLWKVACLSSSQAFWSGERVFTITKPLPVLDLDTTYFPFGLGYKWVYERYSEYYDSYEGETWFDTVTTWIIDSIATELGWRFDFENGGSQWVYGNKAVIFGGRKVLLEPQPFEEVVSEGDIVNTFRIDVDDNNLSLYRNRTEYFGFVSYTYSSTSVLREKGVGTKENRVDDWDVTGFGMYGYSYSDRLLYFIKGNDTVWRCEDCP